VNSVVDFAPDFSALSRVAGVSPLEEYGRFQQHLVLLEDRGRVTKYCAAIEDTPPGNVVVDVGAGTGVLALLALKKGFGRAILIEPSRKMAVYARHLAEINGLSDRVEILNSTLEAVPLNTLPQGIDLIVTETISSLLFGFGSWDALPALVGRTRNGSSIIPRSGQLFVAATNRSLATRGPTSDGLSVLSESGLRVDLFERTFRSGGNVYDKSVVARLLANGELAATQLASFDFRSPEPTKLSHSCVLLGGGDFEATGLLLFWDIALTPRITMTNIDPILTSWYPLYVPLTRSLQLPATLELCLRAQDAPYTYAFQFMAGGEAVSNVLYW